MWCWRWSKANALIPAQSSSSLTLWILICRLCKSCFEALSQGAGGAAWNQALWASGPGLLPLAGGLWNQMSQPCGSFGPHVNLSPETLGSLVTLVCVWGSPLAWTWQRSSEIGGRRVASALLGEIPEEAGMSGCRFPRKYVLGPLRLCGAELGEQEMTFCGLPERRSWRGRKRVLSETYLVPGLWWVSGSPWVECG